MFRACFVYSHLARVGEDCSITGSSAPFALSWDSERAINTDLSEIRVSFLLTGASLPVAYSENGERAINPDLSGNQDYGGW